MAHIMDARVMHRLRGSSQARGGASVEASSRTSRRKASIGNAPSSHSSFASSSHSTLQRTNSHGNVSSRSTSSSRSVRRGRSQDVVATPNLIDLKTISAEEIEWEGYLYKQRKIVKNWTPRYITLQNGTVTVYKSKTHAIAKEPIRGKWVIKEIVHSLPSAGFGGSKLQPELLGFSFLATNGNVIHFIATSLVEKAMWVHMMHASWERSTMKMTLLEPKPRADLHRTASTDDTNSTAPPSSVLQREGSITKHLAEQMLTELLELMSMTSPDAVSERLPSFLRQLSKDCEFMFDLETAEVAEPSCVFKGVYHGREGFVHFIAMYITKYVLASDDNEEAQHRAEDDDHHCFVRLHQLVNKVSGSTTLGKFGLQVTFTPARRMSRLVLSFRQRSSPSSSRSRKSVVANPICLSEHAACFHQGLLTKRSLALSFSDFDVVGVLGQGGFGTVVLVKRHVAPDEYFAIKIIDKHSGAESALKERRILSGVRHPFLACLRFAFQTQTKLYLGLDYYKGGNLYLHMHSSKIDPNVATSGGRRFSVEQARFYAAELAIAIAYLHSHGIIYRDLKPDNIMLDKTGHIRLVDFGISKQLTPDQSGPGQYEPTGTLAGSPAYIAPEQLLTQKPQYGMAADWWSYGVLLYEFLTGNTPFADNNISQMYKKIQVADVNYDRRPAIDEDAVDLMKKLLVRDPAERIGFQELKDHKFFATIDWAKLEVKDVEAPFVPPADQLMQNVHEHFKNMNVEESIGELKGDLKKSKSEEFSHFDEFSFSYDTTRDTFDGLSMADDGWLMRQLQEGAAMRDRLQGSNDEVDCCPASEDANSEEEEAVLLSHPNLNTQESNSSSDGGDIEAEVASAPPSLAPESAANPPPAPLSAPVQS